MQQRGGGMLWNCLLLGKLSSHNHKQNGRGEKEKCIAAAFAGLRNSAWKDQQIQQEQLPSSV